jgi:hypothetical protein
MNPFVEEEQKAGWLRKYTSDANRHAVWVNGKEAQVAEKGSFHCPIWKFNKVVFVWLHDRALPVDLSAARFFSSDKIAIEVQVDLVAQVKETNRALIAVATSFNESFELLRTDVTSIIRKFCYTRQADAIHGAEKDLAEEIVNEMSSASSDSLFTIKSASVCFRIDFLEDAAKRKIAGDIGFEESKTTEKRTTELDQLKMERDLKKVEAECAQRTVKAKTEREIMAADLDNLKARIELTEKYKTAIFHLNPGLYEKIRLAEISNDMEKWKQVVQEVMGMFGAVAGNVKNASAIVIEHTNK